MKDTPIPEWRKAIRNALALTGTTGPVLAVLDGDGGPIVTAPAWWQDGVAHVNYCPRCARHHTHRMPTHGVLYLRMPCEGFAATAYYLVDARSAAQRAWRDETRRRNA